MSESVALEALGMLASTLLGLWEKEEEEDEDDEDDEDDDEEGADGSGAGGGGKKKKAPVPTFSFGVDKAATLAKVSKSVGQVFQPLLGQLWAASTGPGKGPAQSAVASSALLLAEAEAQADVGGYVAPSAEQVQLGTQLQVCFGD